MVLEKNIENRAGIRLGSVLLATTIVSFWGTASLSQTVSSADDMATMSATQKRQMQMQKMRNAIPSTTMIYDPAGGFDGRNVKRGDAATCLQWRGGPQGTLMPMGMTPSPVPMQGTHGAVGLSYNAGCDRAEGFATVSSRSDSFFVRGTLYSEGLGSYDTPGGVTVDSGSDRLSYGLGAGYVAPDGSFFSANLMQMRAR